MGVVKIITIVFTLCSLVLLLISNLGTTFNSSFLSNIYLIQLSESVTGRYIRYGVYNSCLFYPDVDSPHSCTTAIPAYGFDGKQFAEFCGADMTNDSMVVIYTNAIADAKFSTFQGIVLLMPAVILVFLSFFCAILYLNFDKSNIVPFIGAFTSLAGFLSGAAGLALTIATFWKSLDHLERRVEGLSHEWGPSIYMVGVGSGCILIVLVSFFISLFSASDNDDYKRETYNLHDYDLSNRNNHDSAAYDTSPTTYLNQPNKQDNYEYTNAIASPTIPNYPSYHPNNSYNNYNQDSYNNNYQNNYYK